MSLTLVVPGSKEETIRYCVDQFIALAQEAIKERGAFYLALSGGSTPKAIYQALLHTSLDWSRVHLFWSDERSVPPDHPESNYRMAMESLSKLPISHIHRMVAEKDIEANAQAYEALLPDQFDLVMLGMGDDGHTASLFPGTKALDETNRRVVANHVPQKESWRMTMTFPCINSARNVSIYVIGENKSEMLKKVLDGHDFPITRVNGTIIADKNAASLVE